MCTYVYTELNSRRREQVHIYSIPVYQSRLWTLERKLYLVSSIYRVCDCSITCYITYHVVYTVRIGSYLGPGSGTDMWVRTFVLLRIYCNEDGFKFTIP